MIPHLSTAAIGAPITRLGVSFFPIYLLENELPAIRTGPSSELVVRELDDAAVGSLLAVNPTDTPVLISASTGGALGSPYRFAPAGTSPRTPGAVGRTSAVGSPAFRRHAIAGYPRRRTGNGAARPRREKNRPSADSRQNVRPRQLLDEKRPVGGGTFLSPTLPNRGRN